MSNHNLFYEINMQLYHDFAKNMTISYFSFVVNIELKTSATS